MKLEATKFRPREVVKHVLQTAAASLQKILTLEGHVSDDIPIEVRVLWMHFHPVPYLDIKAPFFSLFYFLELYALISGHRRCAKDSANSHQLDQVLNYEKS